MKTIPPFACKLAAVAVALAMFGGATQVMAQTQLAATVLKVTGRARYSSDNKTWQNMHAGDVLRPGTVIQTAEKSTVDLVLGAAGPEGAQVTGVMPVANRNGGNMYVAEEASANTIRMFESSVLSIDKLTAQQTGADVVEETQLDLRAGRILGNVKKLSAASKYEVKIPNGVAGIRGTVYMISSSGLVEVRVGSVVLAVVSSDGTLLTKVVSGGHKFDPLTGALTVLTSEEMGDLYPPPGPGQSGPILGIPTDPTKFHPSSNHHPGHGGPG